MTKTQTRLLIIQAVLAGLHVLNVGLVALGEYKLLALVVASLVAVGQYYVTHQANDTVPKLTCWRCSAKVGEHGEQS